MKIKQDIRKHLIIELHKLINIEVLKYKKSLDTRGCKNKILYKLFIKIFINKLENNLSWNLLGNIYKISKSHIHSTFCAWTEHGVFKNAFHRFLKQYNLFIDNNEAYIDSTTIFNKYGYVDTVGMNTYESKKHKSNKLSVIASKNGIPLGIHIGNGNIHDLNLLINTLPKRHAFKILYADKSYISKNLKQKLLVNKKIKLITPFKKNQREKNTDEEINGLRRRMRIEHINNKLKQNKSLNTRYVKDILYFESLCYLGCLKIGLNVIINDFFNNFN
jgi:transposase